MLAQPTKEEKGSSLREKDPSKETGKDDKAQLEKRPESNERPERREKWKEEGRRDEGRRWEQSRAKVYNQKS
jgi:hypothetical protein